MAGIQGGPDLEMPAQTPDYQCFKFHLQPQQVGVSSEIDSAAKKDLMVASHCSLRLGLRHWNVDSIAALPANGPTPAHQPTLSY